MPSLRPIHIALSFNDKYWALAYTVMRSACLTTKLRHELVFHLFHTPLSPDHAATLASIHDEFGATLRHCNPRANERFVDVTRRLPSNERFPEIVYTRLLLPELLPAEVGRIIYLDCDTLVRHPIELLYDMDMQGLPLAAVADPHHDTLTLGRDFRAEGGLFDPAEPYFNSGVLLIDREKFAGMDVPAHIEKLVETGTAKRLYYDQDMLNHIFTGRWLALDWRFNAMLPHRNIETLDPHILHYTGDLDPWALFTDRAFAKSYRHVMTHEVHYRFLLERLHLAWLVPLAGKFLNTVLKWRLGR